MKTNATVRSANRIRVLFDGQQIGAMQSVRSSDDYGLEGVYEIGSITPREHVPSAARHTLSCSNVVLKSGSMRAAGLVPENGADVLKGSVFDVEIYDDTGTLMRKYEGCSYASGDLDISRNAILMANATFMALNVTGTNG